MPLDPNQLRRDVEARRAARDPGKQPRLGIMAAVRQHLGAIEALRSEGASWVDLAAALTAQGLVQGNGSPLTGRHLTALIASIRRQDAGRAAARARRADLRHAPEVTAPATAIPHVQPMSAADVDPPAGERHRGSPEALFHRLDRKARQAAEAAAERPDFSKGLIK